MATDFGDDAGEELFRTIQKMSEELERSLMQQLRSMHGSKASKPSWIDKMQEKARAWAERRFRDDPAVENPHAQAEEYTHRTPCAVEMPNAETASQFAAYARAGGVWACAFEGENGEPLLACYQEDAQKLGELAREWSRQNPEACREWHEHAVNREQHALPPAEHEYMRDIRSKVESARADAVSEKDFIRRCEDQGLGVSRATDGELLFTHENGWFDVRGDTLGKEYTRDSFERGTGEKSEDLSARAVEDQELYIQSHDGGDIDTRTRVVEHTVKTQDAKTNPERISQQKDYDLESESKDMREASKALDDGHGPKEIGPMER